MNTATILKAAKRRLAAYRRQQAEYRALLRMDERQLRDIGLARDDVAAIFNGGFFADTTRRRRPDIARPAGQRDIATAMSAPQIRNAA